MKILTYKKKKNEDSWRFPGKTIGANQVINHFEYGNILFFYTITFLENKEH